MIKLKSLLTEHINDYSWLDSNGTFYPTDDHEKTAKQLLMKMQLSPMDRDGIEYIPYDLMYKLKFLRVVHMKNHTIGGKDIWVSNPLNAPTNAQIRALIDLAIEGGYNKVEYVKRNAEYKTLWDKSHQME